MFQLGVNNTGKTNVVEYEKYAKEIDDIGQEVLFDVFCDKYTTAYVGQAYSKEKIDALTIE